MEQKSIYKKIKNFGIYAFYSFFKRKTILLFYCINYIFWNINFDFNIIYSNDIKTQI